MEKPVYLNIRKINIKRKNNQFFLKSYNNKKVTELKERDNIMSKIAAIFIMILILNLFFGCTNKKIIPISMCAFKTS